MSPFVSHPTMTRPVYQTDDTMPKTHVDQAGVSRLGSISPNLGGKARCMAIDNEVRAAGRIVVWQLAADELKMAMISNLRANHPKPWELNTTLPVAEMTSSLLSVRNC